MAVLNALSAVYESLDQNERSAALLLDALALSERHDGIPHPNQALFLTELANTEMFAGRSEESGAGSTGPTQSFARWATRRRWPSPIR